jgi:LysM repeat protein
MNLLRTFVVGLFSVFCLQFVDAQVAVSVSKKKTVIEGKTYYLHTVKQDETLYSISKAYNIQQKDIIFNNPGALESIRVGEELKIPEKTDNAAAKTQLESAQFIYHIAEQGQTVYSLMQKYHLTQEELYKQNPELEHSPLQVGQVVTIPKQNSKPSDADNGFRIHEVQKRETLFSIAKTYNLSVNQLMDANPEINSRSQDLRVGQKIKIPLPDLKPIGIPVEISQTDTVIVRKDLEEDTVECVPVTQNNFKIAMLLPLFLSDNAAAVSDTSITKDTQGRYVRKDGTYWISPHSETALEFYQGALLAIDSLNRLGLNSKVYVFDTMRDTLEVQKILSKPLMKEMDLIIGPFHTELVDKTARFAAENHIFYVSPTALNIESVKNSPYLIQVTTGTMSTVAPTMDIISQQRDSIRVVLIGNKSETDQTLFHAYHNKLKTILPDSLISTYQFKVDSLKTPPEYLQKKKKNVVIVTATDEVFITIIAAHLNASTRDYPVNLYGLSVWTNFINLDPEYLHNVEFRFATPYYIDYTRKEVLRFLQQYRKYYATEPNLNKQGSYSLLPVQHAFLGYDILFFFGSAVKLYGKDFGHCVSHFRLPALQSDFHFTKINSTGGHINSNLNIYRYTKNYKVVQEKKIEN